MTLPKLGIKWKLIGVSTVILLIAAATIVIFATNLFSKDNIARVQESNLDSARLLSSEVRGSLTHLTEKMRLIGVTLMQSLTPEQLDTLTRPFFEQERDLIIETVFGRVGKQFRPFGRSANHSALKDLEIEFEEVAKLHQKLDFSKMFAGQETIRRDQVKGNIPVLTISVPLISDDKGNVSHIAVATLRQDRFLKSVQGNSIIQSYLVDQAGYLLAHADQARVLKGENVSHLGIVKHLLSGNTNNGQTRFIDPETNTAFLGAFNTVGFAGIGVISQVEEAKALEAAKKVKDTSLIITIIVAAIAFLVVFYFSLSLTQPLVRLVDATSEVAKGNYEVRLKKGPNDEIGDLTAAFSEMTKGLAEREKIKTAFSKFHSKEMAEKVLSGELKLGGERKEATVFFSDVRGFTAMSEKLDPEALVKILNRYMTRMVQVILDNGGIVDKYVGDAIMAVWGRAPLERRRCRALGSRLYRNARLTGRTQRGTQSRGTAALKDRNGSELWTPGIGKHRLRGANGVYGDRRYRQYRISSGIAHQRIWNRPVDQPSRSRSSSGNVHRGKSTRGEGEGKI